MTPDIHILHQCRNILHKSHRVIFCSCGFRLDTGVSCGYVVQNVRYERTSIHIMNHKEYQLYVGMYVSLCLLHVLFEHTICTF